MPPIGRTQLEDIVEACPTCELKSVEECYALKAQYGTIAHTFAVLEREGWEYFRTRDSGMYRRVNCPVHADPPVEPEAPVEAPPAAPESKGVVPEPPPVSEPAGDPEDPALADTQPMPGPAVVELEVVSMPDPPAESYWNNPPFVEPEVVSIPDPPVEVPAVSESTGVADVGITIDAPEPMPAPWEDLPGAGTGEEP